MNAKEQVIKNLNANKRVSRYGDVWDTFTMTNIKPNSRLFKYLLTFNDKKICTWKEVKLVVLKDELKTKSEFMYNQCLCSCYHVDFKYALLWSKCIEEAGKNTQQEKLYKVTELGKKYIAEILNQETTENLDVFKNANYVNENDNSYEQLLKLIKDLHVLLNKFFS